MCFIQFSTATGGGLGEAAHEGGWERLHPVGRSGGSGGGLPTLLGEPTAATAATFEGEAQLTVRRRPSGTAAAGCWGCPPVQGEKGRQTIPCW